MMRACSQIDVQAFFNFAGICPRTQTILFAFRLTAGARFTDARIVAGVTMSGRLAGYSGRIATPIGSAGSSRTLQAFHAQRSIVAKCERASNSSRRLSKSRGSHPALFSSPPCPVGTPELSSIEPISLRSTETSLMSSATGTNKNSNPFPDSHQPVAVGPCGRI